jgi:ribA/ribD-fused uncharacterized protein
MFLIFFVLIVGRLGDFVAVVGDNLYFYSKSNSYFEFSNSYESSFELDGKWWRTVEHYFQAKKTLNNNDQELIRLASSVSYVRKIGKVVKVREDWEDVKEDFMYRALRAKFTQNSNLKIMLLATGSLKLGENSPNEFYWGCRGKNRLGELLMRLRDEFNMERD